MTLRTITFDDEQWQVVPREPTERMILELMAVGLRNAEYANEGPTAKEIAQGYACMCSVAPEPPAQQPMGAEQIASACYTYRHDFGLLPEVERHLLMAEARRWAAAFGMEVER